MAKLTSKEIVKYTGKVYDLKVANSSTYNIEGLAVHNSAAGCLLSWVLEITNIDPIRFDLYFERFLNPDRIGMPDIDVDFMADTDHIRNEFLLRKYGKERVLNVVTFSTFSEKGTLKDVVRAHKGKDAAGFQSDVFAVTQEMPNFDKVQFSLKQWFENWPQDKECSEKVRAWLTDPENKIILEQTVALQGGIRNLGIHAAGVVITPGPSWEYLPTNFVAKEKTLVTAFQEADKSGKDLSELKIQKLDLLTIETLNVIVDTIGLIKEKKNIDVSEKVYNVDIYDSKLYDEVRLGLNQGIFQFESSVMASQLKGMRCESFEELVAANALIRPGAMAMKSHEEYTKNKFDKTNIKSVHPAIDPILSKTNGVLAFQEQLMFLAHEIAGMTLGEGDQLRRYMDKASQAIKKFTKKEPMTSKEEGDYKAFDKYWNKFLDGAAKKGYKKEEVDSIKLWISECLGYSFNRCLTENNFVYHREKGQILISDVKVGDYILCYNPENGKDEYNMVKDIHQTGMQYVYNFVTRSGNSLEATLEHKIMTEKNDMMKLSDVMKSDNRVVIHD